MTPLSVIALFCEDVREEKGGLFTVIGIMPDNIEAQVDSSAQVEGVPAIPKLCIYARLQFDPNEDIGVVKTELIFPNDEVRQIDMFDAPTVERARRESLAKGVPIAGIYSRLQMINFPIYSPGRLRLDVTVKGKTYIAGALNLTITKATSTTDAVPPS